MVTNEQRFTAHFMAFGKCSIPCQQYTFIDKSSWPDGPWHNEPDRVIWHDAGTGLPCIINRHSQGFWNGYVGVPNGHRLHGIHADDVSLEAHQGVDFSGAPLINHLDQNGLSLIRGWYWFGFTLSWHLDLIPVLSIMPDYQSGHIYRDMEYAKSECKNLASQLAAIR